MIETRLALPVRSPHPLIVPWTCVAPISTAAIELATPHSASLWQWIPTRMLPSSVPTASRVASVTCDGSDDPFVSQRTTVSAPAPGRRPHARAGVVRVVPPRVEEVLGVVDHALALADEEGDRLGDHPEVLGTVDSDHLLEVQTPRLADQRADSAHRIRPAAAVRDRRRRGCPAGGSSRRRRSPPARSAPRRAARTAHAPWGSKPESPPRSGGSELVELVRDTDLLVRGEGHPLPLHAVAQGRVI